MLPRALLLGLIYCILAVIFIIRLAQLQLFQGADFADAVTSARHVVDVLPARRGRLIDRNGTALVDNRAVYHAALVLADLELGRRDRRRLPIYRLDRARLDRLVSDLSRRLDRPLAELRRQLTDELLLNPGVAVRHGARGEDLHLGLLAIPKQVLIEAEADGSSNQDPRWAALAESGILHDEAALALSQEFLLRRGQAVDLFDDAEWNRFLSALADAFDSPPDHLAQALGPFAPQITMPSPGAKTEGDGIEAEGAEAEVALAWRALSEDRRLQAVDTLARFVGSPTQVVATTVTEAIADSRSADTVSHWLFVPSARIGELASRVPEGAPVFEVPLSGAAPARERIFLLQGDLSQENGRGMFSLLQRRLAAALDLPMDQSTEWVAALIEAHAEKIGIRTAEREHRIHHIAFDAAKVERACRRLAAELASLGRDLSPIDLEQRLTQARRLADREWRGFTRRDPLAIVEDLPHLVARRVDGLGAQVPRVQSRRFEGTEATVPGLRIIADIGREYPYPGTASHLIGYLGRLSAVYDHDTALAMGLDPSGWLGRSGLEAHYDELLQGVNGRRVRLRTPTGSDIIEELAPVPGVDLHLTLDVELQRATETALERWLELAEELGVADDKMRAARERANHGRGGMVLMDPRDGAILALASNPSFDLAEVRSRYRELADPKLHPGQPLQDHASAAAHPPGSTVKPMVALAGMVDGVISPGEQIWSPGYMARTRSGKPILREHSPFSPRYFDAAQAITKSSNVYFATVADRMGKHNISAWFWRFGFGQRNGVDTPWQRPGLLPLPDTLAWIRPREPTWYPSDSWRMGIGQFCSASPLQTVSVPAAIANGGTIVQPYLWQKADRPAIEHLQLSPAALRSLRKGMEDVTVRGGTASKLILAGGQKVAAKTGTSEWGTRSSRSDDAKRNHNATWTPDHAWLVGYAPAEAPRVAFAIFIHSGTSGGRATSGVAKLVLERYFERYPVDHR